MLARFLLSLVFFALLTACGEKRVQGFPPRDTSLISIVAQPERFEGKKVTLQGFYDTDWEISALYPTRSHRISAANGIWVETRDSKAAADVERQLRRGGTWVRVVGIFTAREHGHTDRWPGTLKAIESMTIITWSEDGERANKAPEPTPTSVTPPAAQESRRP